MLRSGAWPLRYWGDVWPVRYWPAPPPVLIYLPRWRRASRAEFVPVGAWGVRRVRLDPARMVLELADRRERLAASIPAAIYTPEAHPSAHPTTWGNTIPRLYGRVVGVPCRCVDAAARVFEVAGHALRRLREVAVDGAPVGPAWVDLAAGLFALAEWDGAAEVTADADGLSGNAADVLADVLAQAGETDLDLDSFAAARAGWRLGVDPYGEERHSFEVGLWLGEAIEAGEVVAEVLRAAWGLLYLDGEGRWVCRAWAPRRASDAAAAFRDRADLLGLEREARTDTAVSRVVVRYLSPAGDGAAQTVELRSTEARARLGLGQDRTLEYASPFASRGDALAWASRALALWGRPAHLWRAEARPSAVLLWPGDAVRVDTEADDAAVLEVVARRADPSTGAVTLELSPWRGFAHRAAWVVEAAAAFPAELGGAAVSAWSGSWGEEARAYALAEWGFVADGWGYLDATDPRTRHASTPI